MALVLPFTAATTGLLSNVAAQAQAATGSLSFVSDPGDYVGGGGTGAYSTANSDALTIAGSPYQDADDQGVMVSVSAANGDWWSLILQAPSGQVLAPGTYTGARFPYGNVSQPGLDFAGAYSGSYYHSCNINTTGSFTITDVVFGPYGYVQQLDATFVQHCNSATDALNGEVHISNPPAPPVLESTVDIAADGVASTVDGRAVVHGTVTCNQPTTLNMYTTVTQEIKHLIYTGHAYTLIDCTPGAAVPWSAAAVPATNVPFRKGAAEVELYAYGIDPNYGEQISVTQNAVVMLSWGKP